MYLRVEIPDSFIKDGKFWNSSEIMRCSQCDYVSPVPALFVTHVFNEHGMEEKVPEVLVLDK